MMLRLVVLDQVADTQMGGVLRWKTVERVAIVDTDAIDAVIEYDDVTHLWMRGGGRIVTALKVAVGVTSPR